ncbi:hypothetical protein BCR35DRAFT_297091 [Leucosporidium creatinivorum]|uniref:t-SNARE affecting a late Golgi compartment protein 1 n=1 Tax=Leucosporidium creatinivorum TaxID=106004 RepID=A0A1Y2CQI4_9BASI|nr:hypothetical protein BCR35DRAFT_297091 [Leucosporidium creatinivorum]
MSADPYFEVKAEVESTLHCLTTLSSSYSRLSRTAPPGSEELSYALAELKATLSSIEGDVVELVESVEAVEERGVAARLGIAEGQVRERRAFVERVKREIQTIRGTLPVDGPSSPDLARERLSATQGYLPPLNGDESEMDGQEDFEMQHQTLLMEQQDRTLTDISGTVGLLREQAKVMGREVFDQNVLLDEIDSHVDSTSNRLERAQRKMEKFIQSNKNSASSWLIFGLIIILCILLFIILFL